MNEIEAKNKIALLQLETLKTLHEAFNTQKFKGLITELTNDPKISKDERLQQVFESLNEMNQLHKSANKLSKWAPVHHATIGVILDHMQTILIEMTLFSIEARGREKSKF